MNTTPPYLGNQYIIELYGCDEHKLDDIESLQTILEKAALSAGATIVQKFFHKFSPQGVSGTIVIAESHLNLHTWPEFNFAAIDIFTCGENLSPEKAMETLVDLLHAKHYKLDKIKRGTDIRNWSRSSTPSS